MGCSALCVNLFAGCILIACAILIIILPVLVLIHGEVTEPPPPSSLETATRMQSLFLALTACTAIAAYTRRTEAHLHPLGISCCLFSGIGLLFTAAVGTFKILEMVHAAKNYESTDFIRFSTIVNIGVLVTHCIAAVCVFLCFCSCLHFLCRYRSLNINRDRATAANRRRANQATGEDMMNKEVTFDDNLRLVDLPRDVQATPLRRPPSGKAYLLPVGTYVMVESMV